jgi:hypothetical protein
VCSFPCVKHLAFPSRTKDVENPSFASQRAIAALDLREITVRPVRSFEEKRYQDPM